VAPSKDCAVGRTGCCWHLQALFCQVPAKHVLNMHDVRNIWHVPLVLEDQGAHHSICSALNLGGAATMQLGFWRNGLAERWDKLASMVSPFQGTNLSTVCPICRELEIRSPSNRT